MGAAGDEPRREQLRRDAERLRQHNPDWAQHLVDLWPASPDEGATLAHVANVVEDVFSLLREAS